MQIRYELFGFGTATLYTALAHAKEGRRTARFAMLMGSFRTAAGFF